jgi:hypothetical protein
MNPLELQEQIEDRLIGLLHIRKAEIHTLLGVSKTSWFEYSKGIRPMPEYVAYSIQAHLALPDMELDELMSARLIEEPKPTVRPAIEPDPLD